MPLSLIALAPAIYVAAWTSVPLLDKIALRTITERAMMWGTFVVGALLATAALAAVALGRGGARGARAALAEGRAALSAPVVWAVGLATVVGYLAYFSMLSKVDVHKVTLLNPLVLCATLLATVLVLGERIRGSQALGVGIVLCGLVAFYWQDLAAVVAGGRRSSG